MQDMIQYFLRLREKYDKLMTGRNGFDTMAGDSLVVWFICGLINGFVRSRIFSLVMLIFPVFAAFRMLSRNIGRRTAENERYLAKRGAAAEYLALSKRRFSERKTHKYIKCSNCDAQIRVKREKGSHTVDCPKCGKELHIKIR